MDEGRLRQLETLAAVSALVNSTLDPHEVQRKTIEALTRLLDCEAGSLLLIDEETGELYFEAAVGEKGSEVRAIRLAPGEGVAGWVVENRRTLLVDDVSSDPRFCRKADDASGFVTRAIICVPVTSKGRIVGVLEGINRRGGPFTEADAEALAALANQVAVAVENARLYQELKDAFYATSQALSETIELRDPYTGGHTRRVMVYSLAIGRRLGLDREEMERLRLAAILHDIGKVGVEDGILRKAAPLDAAEREAMSRHAEYGSEILEHIRQLRDIVPGVRGHHERYDGAGYPDRLVDGSIPLLARVIAVADTFDAMTTDRPYRKGLHHTVAFGELERCSGSQFDPRSVDAFVTAWREGDLSFDPPPRPEAAGQG